ncbi:DUF5819 family protein [Streptomyces sp. NPDC003691]
MTASPDGIDGPAAVRPTEPTKPAEATEPTEHTGTDTGAEGDAEGGTAAGEGGPDGGGTAGAAPRTGIAALSLPYQITAAVALGLVALVAGVHLLLVFLHVAPSNTATKQYSEAIDSWVYPEFEQNWKLFAPNPLQQNIRIQVKAELTTGDGGKKTTEWIDLTAGDIAEIRGNLLPGHTLQNLLRRSWDFYTGSHDDKNRATGPRGALAQSYLKRVVMFRLDKYHGLGAEVERIQVRSETELVEPPSWSKEKNDTRPVHRTLPWWNITAEDRPLGAGVRAAGPAFPGTGPAAGIRIGERTEAAR